MRLGKFISISWGILLIKKGPKADSFVTPLSLVKLIVDVIEPNYGRILDPACGAGGMLVSTGSRKICVNKKA
jgi:type I restriction enzyme M protein